MTERKPAGTSWESWIESQIRVAMEQGAFDNLPGAGKPLPDLGQDYDPMWWVKQLARREQLSLLPPALELLRKVETELATLGELPDEAPVRRRVAALNGEIARVNATVLEGPPTGSWRSGARPAPPVANSVIPTGAARSACPERSRREA